MKKIVTILCICLPAFAQNPVDKLIFPDITKKIILLEEVDSKSGLIAGRPLQNHKLNEQLLNELNDPFYQSLIKLNQCSRNLAGNTDGDNVLLLSSNEGGFARHGLTRIEDNTRVDYPELNYVDLVVDEQNTIGALDIFAHELGHVMMQNIWTNFAAQSKNKLSSKMHVSMGITDYYVAISEGFGEQFQRLTNEHIATYQTLFENKYRSGDGTSRLWHSSIDEELRLTAVLTNKYIFKKIMPQGPVLNELSAEEKILLSHTSPIYDPSRLKNAQEMLSSEGVLATLFYKMNTNQILQNNYQDKSFYNAFLLSAIPDNLDIKTVFSGFENVMLKQFWIWRMLNRKDLAGKAPLLEFIREWINAFPEDKTELISMFIGMTAGKTVNNRLADLFESLSLHGMVGNYSRYAESRKQYRQELEQMINDVINGRAKIDGNIGPEIWIENQNLKIRQALWMEEPKSQLRININTADEFDLSSFVNIDLETARRIIHERDKLGYFSTMAQFEAIKDSH
ncbi:MAG: helix-hairpin-helix domain-containing protein [Calditrichaeota bacterium]|nr:helix-hairpin-helix domain-containing protein [Calditrichota bacterium]